MSTWGAGNPFGAGKNSAKSSQSGPLRASGGGKAAASSERGPKVGRGRGGGRGTALYPKGPAGGPGAPQAQAKPLRRGAKGAAAAARAASVAAAAPEALDRLIGHRVQLVLKSGRVADGIMFGADASGTIVLQQASAQLHGSITGNRRVRMVNASSVASVQVQGLKVDPLEQAPLGTKLPAIDQDRIRTKESSVKDLLVATLRRSDSGVDVQVEALFDTLHRMLPGTKWEGERIVVGEVGTIGAPYRSENVRPRTAKSDVSRLKAMVVNFWAKAEQKAAAGGAGAGGK